MSSKAPSNSEVPAGAVSAVNPEAGGILQLSPEDEAVVNQYAQQKGVTKAEAVRSLLAYSPNAAQGQAQPSVMEKTLGIIGQAQQLGVAGADPNDVINSMGRGVVIQSLAKGLDGREDNKKRQSLDPGDLKEMMYLRIMGKMAGVNDDDNNSSIVPPVIQDLKAQNEKLMQEMKERDARHEQQIKEMEEKRQAEKEKEKEKSENDKRFERLENLILELKSGDTGSHNPPPSELQNLKEQNEKLIQELRDSRKESDAKFQQYMEKQDAKMRELVLEKKIQDGEKNIAAVQANVMQEVKSLNEKVELIRSIPPTTAPPKDGVSELEELGGKITRIKTALEPIFPHVSAPAASNSTLPPVPATPLKNPDGSTDYIAAAERIGTIVVKGLEAINKEKPPKTMTAAQPAQADQPAYTEKRMLPEEYANYLLSLPSRTQEQEQWLINYRAYLEREYAKLLPVAQQQPVQQQITKPVQQATGCSICGNPVYQDGYCGKCWADINVPKQQEPAETTWEQAEATRARLIQKQEWTGEEARWMNEYEKVRQAAGLANQQGTQEEQPRVHEQPRVQEYKPPASEVHTVQEQAAGADIQPEAQPVAQIVEEPVPHPEAGQLQGTPAEVQAVTEPLAEQPVEQPQEWNAEDTVERMKKEEEERTARLKGIL